MMKTMNDGELAQRIMARHTAMCTVRDVWATFWQDIANYVMPRKSEILSKTESPGTQKQNQLFDTTAIRANQVLANGMLAWMTPGDSRWFSYEVPGALKDSDDSKQWFAMCSEIVQFELSRSNFYSEIHEGYLNEGAFGTNVLFAEEGRRTTLNFTNFDIGTYAIAEDDEGLADYCDRSFKMSAAQLASKFGAEALSERSRRAAEDEKRKDEKLEVLHCIYRRGPGEYDATRNDGPNKPWASVYLEKGERHVLSVGGFQEQPFFCSRFLKWGDHPYGWSPSWMALPEARQLNFLEKSQDALAERKAFPPVLLPIDFEGSVDLRAAGVTYFDHSKGTPTEWATSGDYNVGRDRAEWKRQAINSAFHVDMFQMFAQLEQRMTAREVAERTTEKLVQFSPTFARKMTELYNPLLQRVWGICIRAGLFPPPPEDLVQEGPEGLFLPEPQITYSSRIALAIKGLENVAFYRMMEGLTPVLSVQPDVIDNFDLDEIARDTSRNDGLPARWMRPVKEVEALRQQRADAQAQAAEMQQQMVQAKMLHAAGSVRDDSVAGRAAQEQLEVAG
jgi:hypothetical protein